MAQRGALHAWHVLCLGGDWHCGMAGGPRARWQHYVSRFGTQLAISRCIQVARIGQILAEFPNLARLLNIQPLLQAHGGPQPMWWPFGGLGDGPSPRNDGLGWFHPWRFAPYASPLRGWGLKGNKLNIRLWEFNHSMCQC